METNTQARTKVSKPNKLRAAKKLLGNIRYFPMQLVARWLKSLPLWREILAGVPEECDLVSCCGHSFIMGHVALAALPSLKPWGGFTATSKDQLAEGTGGGVWSWDTVLVKELLWEGESALSPAHIVNLPCSISTALPGQELLYSCVQCTWWSITDVPWWGLSMLLWISAIRNAPPKKEQWALVVLGWAMPCTVQ